jgi:nitrate reductase assembly molybdenum cofactor insertion protein NarJ
LRAPATAATTTKATSLQHILPAVFHLNFLDMGCAVAARLLQEVRHPLQEQQLCLARPSSRWPVIIMMLKL